MKTLFVFLAVCILIAVCWPLAVVAVLLWPLLWIISLPFRLLFIVVEAVFALIKAVLFLPARLFGDRGNTAGRAP